MRNVLTSLGEVVGLTCVAIGAALIYAPAGWIAGGAALFAVSWVAGGDE